ncbi:MAG: hypothetical protein KKD39_04095, partial [Candidatus Altiarchaeota archaeon]|nr:hypothetical protein [Candidatus Altiarchaeota archaeon]
KNALFVFFLLPALACAVFDGVVSGTFDFLRSIVTLNLVDALKILSTSFSVGMTPGDWPTLTAVHNSFTWIGGFFVVAFTLQGIKYIVSADSPHGRAQAKQDIQKLVVGMVVVGLAGHIYQLGLDLGDAMTASFVSFQQPNWNTVEGLLNRLVMSTVVICIITGVGSFFAIFFLVVVSLRYLLLLVLWALFPVILALYVSGMGFLSRIGAKGVNLYIACVFSGPVMALFFNFSLNTLSNLAQHGFEPSNAFDSLIALLLAYGGFIAAILSPTLLFGLTDKFGTIANTAASLGGAVAGGVVTGGVGAVAGSMMGSKAAASSGNPNALDNYDISVPTSKNIREAGEMADEKMEGERLGVELAARKNLKVDDFKDKMFEEGLANGQWSVDSGGIVQVESGGRHKYPGEVRENLELALAHGRGFGDKICQNQAAEDGVLSDNKIILKNAIKDSLPSGDGIQNMYVGDSGGLNYEVVVEDSEKSGYFSIPKKGFSSQEDVVERIRETAEMQGLSSYQAALKYRRG